MEKYVIIVLLVFIIPLTTFSQRDSLLFLHYHNARVSYFDEKYDEALASLSIAIEHNNERIPNYFYLLKAKGLIHLERGEFDDAWKCFNIIQINDFIILPSNFNKQVEILKEKSSVLSSINSSEVNLKIWDILEKEISIKRNILLLEESNLPKPTIKIHPIILNLLILVGFLLVFGLVLFFLREYRKRLQSPYYQQNMDIPLLIDNETKFFKAHEIIYFQKAGNQNYADVFLSTTKEKGEIKEEILIKKALVIRSSIKALAGSLPNPIFTKIGRSTIINIFKFHYLSDDEKKRIVCKIDSSVELTVPRDSQKFLQDLLDFWNNSK